MAQIDFAQVITAEAQAAAAAQAQAEAEARRLLAETDWYVVRKIETGAAVPRAVTEARQAARATLSETPPAE